MSTPGVTLKRPSAWRRWRTSRPFWGALFICLSGAEILLAVKAPLPVVLHVGMQGLVGYLVPVIILVCGVLLFITPAQRLFYSTIAAVCVLASWATSNLGGFVLGMVLGLVGSALAFAWAPDAKKRKLRAASSAPAAPETPASPDTESSPETPASPDTAASPETPASADTAASLERVAAEETAQYTPRRE
jgi:hypothetical protein